MGDSALEIGVILGDGDAASMVWSRAIGDVALRAEELSASLASPISVNVVFHVDGRHVPNEFEGVRTGRFSRASSTLVVQVAMPKDLVGDHTPYLVGLVGDAVAAAEEYVVRKKLGTGLPELRQVVSDLADRGHGRAAQAGDR